MVAVKKIQIESLTPSNEETFEVCKVKLNKNRPMRKMDRKIIGYVRGDLISEAESLEDLIIRSHARCKYNTFKRATMSLRVESNFIKEIKYNEYRGPDWKRKW